MISGCRDEQTSADAYISGKFTGAMTTAFVKCLRQWFKVHKKYPNYTKLLSLMLNYMRKNKYSQRPQINCSHNQDIKSPLDI